MTAAFEAARDFADHGFGVFPCFGIRTDGACTCDGARKSCTPGKHPITANGVDGASTDEARLLHWDDAHPDANWAVHCDRLVAVEIDSKAGADPREVIAKYGLEGRPGVWSGEAPEPSPGKYQNSLPGVRGAHVYCAGGFRGIEKAAEAGVGIRGLGQYVMLAGSRHWSGFTYEAMNGARPWTAALEPVPATLAAKAAEPYTPPPAGERIPHGARYPHLKDFAVRFARAGVADYPTMLAHLVCELEARCVPDPAPQPGSIEELARWAVQSEIAQRERGRSRGHADFVTRWSTPPPRERS